MAAGRTALLAAIGWSAAVVLGSGCAGLRVNQSFRTGPTDWTMQGGAPDHKSIAIASLTLPLKPVWQYNANAGIAATPLVRDSIVVLATMGGELQAVDFTTGKRIGYMTLESAVLATPTLDGTIVFVPVASSKESIFAYDLHDGRKVWTQRAYGPIETSPLLVGDNIYVTSLAGSLYCLGKFDGDERWKFSVGIKEDRKPIRSSPSSDGTLIFFGCDDGIVYAVRASTGELAWKFPARKAIFASPTVVNDAVIVGSLDGSVYALNTSNGTLRWKYETGAPVYGPASSDGTLAFVPGSDGVLYSLNASTGTLAWKFATESVLASAPLVSGSTLLFGSLDKTVTMLQTSDGKELWRFTADGRVRVSPVIWGNALLVVSEDKFLTCLRTGPSLGEADSLR